jgi:endoglucanase Acf2
LYANLSPELRALSDFEDITCPLWEGEVPPQQQQLKHDGERNLDDLATSSSSSALTATLDKKLGICDKAMDLSMQKKVITGVQFVVTTKEGLVWLVFASEPITFELDRDAMRSIQSREKYNGVIRLALVPPTTMNADASTSDESSGTMSLDTGKLSSSSGVKRLIYHASAYPVGSTVSWDF